MIVSQTGPDRKVELKVEKDSVTITAFWAFIVGRARKAHVKEYVHLTLSLIHISEPTRPY